MQALTFFRLVLKHCVLSSVKTASAVTDESSGSVPVAPLLEPTGSPSAEPDTSPTPTKRSSPPSNAEGTPNNDETCAPPPKKKKADEMWIHEILDDLRTGKVLYDSDRCLPASVVVERVAATKPAPVWSFYRKLATPIFEKIGATKRVFGMRILPVSKSKEYHHVCTECINDVKELGTNANEESWQRSLCKIANTTNGENHLRSKHGDSQAVKDYFHRKNVASPSKTKASKR